MMNDVCNFTSSTHNLKQQVTLVSMSRFLTLCFALSLSTFEAFKPSTPTRTSIRSSINMGSIIDELKSEGNFNTLLAAIDAAGLTEMYKQETLTLLAPNVDFSLILSFQNVL